MRINLDFLNDDEQNMVLDKSVVNVHILRMRFVQDMNTPMVEVTNKLSVNFENLKKYSNQRRFKNTEGGRASCIQYNWVMRKFRDVLLENPDKDLRVMNWSVKSGNKRAFKFCDVFFCDITFFSFGNEEHRLFGRPETPMRWKSGKMILKGKSSIHKILSTYDKERNEREKMKQLDDGFPDSPSHVKDTSYKKIHSEEELLNKTFNALDLDGGDQETSLKRVIDLRQLA